MKQFFISFSSEDLSLANYVHDYFSDLFQGKAQFFLSDRIEPSEIWLNRLSKEFKRADGGLFLLTNTSVDREWLNIELGALLALEKEIFPLLVGSLTIGQVHRPLTDYQAVVLSDPSSVGKLIRKLSSICLDDTPPTYDARSFSENVRKRAVPSSALPDIKSVVEKLDLEEPLTPENLTHSQIETEPHLIARVVDRETLVIDGNVKDAGLVSIAFTNRNPAKYLIVEVANSENITKCFSDQLLKIVVGNDPILPLLKSQQHPRDSEYVVKQDGFFLYSLKGFSNFQELLVKIVFWRIEMSQLSLRLFFARDFVRSQTIDCDMPSVVLGS